MYNRELGQKCKKFRKKQGITQKQLADILSTTISSISAFENGRNNNATILMGYINLGFSYSQWNGGVTK